MKRPQPQEHWQDAQVSVPTDALDRLLESIWEWAFDDYLATSIAERPAHIFNTIVRLDSALHGITVEESWVRIKAWHGKRIREQGGDG